MEERIARCKGDLSKYIAAWSPDYKEPPQPCKYSAQDIILDDSFMGPVLKDGALPAPVWQEPTDPCLEDVYAMVWDMLAGQRYAGFRPGIGFGLTRAQSLLTNVSSTAPFLSPSDEALYHAANHHV